jgi:hypothetical protein
MLNMAISMLSSVYMTLYWPSVALMLAWLVMFLVILGVIAERLSEDTTAGSVEPLLAEPRSRATSCTLTTPSLSKESKFYFAFAAARSSSSSS